MMPTNQRPQRLTLIGFGLAGFALSVYLLVVHLRDRGLVCTVGQSCPLLQDQEYAQLAGVPLPVIGLVAFALVIAAAALDNDRARLVGMMVPLAGTFVMAWLTYIEFSEVGSMSSWTVILAGLLAGTLVATIWRELSVHRELTAGAASDTGDDGDTTAQMAPAEVASDGISGDDRDDDADASAGHPPSA